MEKDLSRYDDESERKDYGILVISCDEFPHIIMMNEKMKDILGVNESNKDWLRFPEKNIYFMIPEHERSYFAERLENTTELPSSIEHAINSAAGKEQYVTGWIRKKCIGEESVYYITYIEGETRHKVHLSKICEFNTQIMKSIYENVFIMNLDKNSIKCIKNTNVFSDTDLLERVWVYQSAVDIFTTQVVDSSYTEKIYGYFEAIRKGYFEDNVYVIPDIDFKTRDGNLFRGIFVKQNHSIWFMCCSRIKESDTNVSDKEEKKIKIRTFGYFDVFVDNEAIAFKYANTKELLAIIVDRRGGYVTTDEAISYLWEDETSNTTTRSRYRKVLMRLSETLVEYGIDYILEKKGSNRRIRTEKVECDLYDYLDERASNAAGYDGVYMLNYSWGEYHSWK